MTQILNIFRSKSFWVLDSLKGKPIKNHWKEIENVLENPFSNDSEAIRENNLQKMLSHAVNTVPFYTAFSDYGNLQDFPVITKKKIQDNFESHKSNKYDTDTLFKVSTSGSTGVPFVLYHDKGKRKRNSADVICFSKKAGYSIGNLLIELEVWRGHNTRNGFKNFLQNTVQFDITRLTEDRIAELLKLFSKSSDHKNVLGFPSALETMCQYIDANRIKPRTKGLKSVIANSEYLNNYTRESIQRIFKCPIYSRYSSEELGIIAHQTEDSGSDFRINWASYYVEILDLEKDIPAPKGTYGRLVITDLFNFSMPLIRYDTGDIAMFNESNKKFLKTVEGRKMDMVFDTEGQMLSSYVVYTKFYPFYNLLNQYQFIQIGQKEYHIKLNLKSDRFDFENELIDSIKADFGNDAIVTLEFVHEIPPLLSGKRKKVVNLYKEIK